MFISSLPLFLHPIEAEECFNFFRVARIGLSSRSIDFEVFSSSAVINSS